ncbi:hypothetical protein BDL97_16G086100 [Sphagnum fallax]|nr:hypothetical protein BDL97_16G086100 [Sphagnum fallax]
MAMASRRLSFLCTFFLFFLAVFLLCLSSSCTLVDAKKKETKGVVTARKEDVKYIKCGVCEEIVKQLSRQVKKKRDKIAPKKLTEFQIIETAENICNMKREEGDWILWLDIVEQGDKLKVVEQQAEGECNTECRTIERACQEVMGDYDTDVAEFLYKPGAQRAGLSKLLCKDLSKACVGKVPPVPKDREPGEAFTPKPTKDAEMERLMRSMSDMPGAGGMKMYSREDLTNNPDLVGGGPEVSDDDEEEDDDSDDDVDFQNLLRESKSTTAVGKSPQDSKVQKVLDVVSQIGIETGRLLQSAKEQVDRTAAQLSDWWYGKKPSSKSSTASKSKTKSRSGSSSYEL